MTRDSVALAWSGFACSLIEGPKANGLTLLGIYFLSSTEASSFCILVDWVMRERIYKRRMRKLDAGSSVS